MSILGFSPEFRDKVEDGRKCRTYRRAKCIYERKTGRCSHIGIGSMCSHDYLNCPGYEYRIKKGDTIHAYTGLRQRKYCKLKGWNVCDAKTRKGECTKVKIRRGYTCKHQGALLLRPDLPRCIDTYPIKLKNIAEEDARLDGFTAHYHKKYKREYTALECLHHFFINTYNAKPDTPIQAIIWEELKGDKAGK